ncbi:hypothetical protein Scep_004745 [Stephania cephalantha]|uniref:HECT-type E3 ubiquitin transferase n=1 Tax=Stephania cephalantha TaxID=152367 RepID=A0AAP0PZE6_9MAGN
MESRGRKRVEMNDQLPADKRACSSTDFRPASSTSTSSAQTHIDSVNSVSEPPDCEMETTTSSSSASVEGGGKYYAYGSCDSDGLDDSEQGGHPSYRGYYHHRRVSEYQERFRRILASLKDEASADRQLSALTELCDVLSFCTESSIACFSGGTFAPVLVKLTKHENNPDIVLLAVRVITYLCDVSPRSSAYLVRHDVVPALCAQLMTIEYLDVAEQCLQALEKISRDHPIACLEAGAVMAMLNYIDFFSTSIQRVALSTVANICKRLSSDKSSFLMHAIPIFCNLLQYEDRKLVDNVCLCLMIIVERVSNSSELLDELSKHGLIHQVLHLISSKSFIAISQHISAGLIGVLCRLACCSVAAVKTLLELNVGCSLKHILSTCGLSCGISYPTANDGQCNQVQEVLKLLNELLPQGRKNEDISPTVDKEEILRDQPELLQQLGIEILPVLIQVVNSGANLYICYGCLSIINKFVYFSRSDMLVDLLKDSNISSFLTGVFARKNRHMLISVLNIVENILQKLPHVFLDIFIKEGVIYVIDSLLKPEKCSWFTFPTSSDIQVSSGSSSKSTVNDITRCLCFAFDNDRLPLSDRKSCLLDKDCVETLAARIKSTYFTSNPQSLQIGLTETIQNLRNLCSLLTDKVQASMNGDIYAHDQQEEQLFDILHRIMAELHGRECISTFEFIESGIVKSLVTYLSSVHVEREVDHLSLFNGSNVFKRLGLFAKLVSSPTGFDPQGMPLALLVRKLQNALASLEDFPVILSHVSKLNNRFATIPHGRCTGSPCMKVHLVREKGETELRKYGVNVATVEPFSSLDAIEKFLWPKVCPIRHEREKTIAGQLGAGGQSKDAVSQEGVDQQSVKGTDSVPSIFAEAPSTESPTLFPNSCTVRKTQDSANGPILSNVTTTFNVSSAYKEDIAPSSGDDSPKLAFYFDGKHIDRRLTFYQVIIQQKGMAEQDFVVGPKFWNEVYEVMYGQAEETKQCHSKKCVDVAQISSGCSSPEKLWQSVPFSSSMLRSKLPFDLDKSNPTYELIYLLKILDGINRFAFQLLSMDKIFAYITGERKDLDDLGRIVAVLPQAEFMNSKLTEKIEQQMRDPLVVSAGSMPSWCTQLVVSCPYLFGFESRCKYFRLITFGSSRFQPSSSLQSTNWNSNAPDDRRDNTGGSLKKKFQVCRNSILASAAKMMNLHAHNQSVLEVKYDDEVGSGLGPTMEFYTLVSHEFQKTGLGMWRGDLDNSSVGKKIVADISGFLMAPLGLFPRPWFSDLSTSNNIQFSEVIKRFILLGQIVAKALQDGRVLDIHFSKAFYKLILEQELTIFDIHTIDPEIGRTLLEFQAIVDRKKLLESVSGTAFASELCFRNAKIEDLCLDFTLPGYPDCVLAPEHELKSVNLANLEEYIKLVVDATVHGAISRQVEAFKYGFNQVFPIKNLQIFTEKELEHLLCGERDVLSMNSLLEHIKFDHGYSPSSPPIVNLLEIIQEFGFEQQRAFLQFVTGAPRLPPGGLAALNPKLTIVRKHCSDSIEGDLPSVMTCANYLKLPPYSSKERMRERLLYAITDGQGSFHLS